jgi:hypothetical protein
LKLSTRSRSGEEGMNIHPGMKRRNKELLKEFLLVLPLQALREETRNLQVSFFKKLGLGLGDNLNPVIILF